MLGNIVDNMNNLLNAIEMLDIKGWQTVLYTGNDMQTPNQMIDVIDAYYTTLSTNKPKGKLIAPSFSQSKTNKILSCNSKTV